MVLHCPTLHIVFCAPRMDVERSGTEGGADSDHPAGSAPPAMVRVTGRRGRKRGQWGRPGRDLCYDVPLPAVPFVKGRRCLLCHLRKYLTGYTIQPSIDRLIWSIDRLIPSIELTPSTDRLIPSMTNWYSQWPVDTVNELIPSMTNWYRQRGLAWICITAQHLI